MTLYDEYGKPSLTIDPSKEINRGGEGTIYEHPAMTGQVIKVYHQRGNLDQKVLKELMQLPDNFIKPLELFFDKQGFLKGLSMKYLDTHRLYLLANIFSKPAATKAGFTEKVKQDIYASLVSCLVSAHKLGIVIGDLNPYNVFVSNKAEVYFIDVDSFQTRSRPHSGVMLPEIRDWMYSHICDKSDYYALSVMVFQLFTHLHPYKGVHRKVQKLEDRVIQRISVLSGDPELIIPSFYEPFMDAMVRDEFFRIFQNAERFLPNVARGMVYPTTPVAKVATFVQAIKEGELTIRTVDIDVEDFNCSDRFFYTRKDTEQFTIYRSTGPGAWNRYHVYTQAEGCILGNTNVVVTKYSTLYLLSTGGADIEVKNFRVPPNSFMHINGKSAIYFDERNDAYYLLNVDQTLDSHIEVHKDTIYTKSITCQTGLVQSVMGNKWILDISAGVLRTLRTTVNVTDVFIVPSGEYGVVEVKSNSQVEHHLFAVKGMRVLLGPKLNGMSIIAEKGDHLYIPTNGAIDVYRKSDLAEVATIACKYVNEQSVLRCCNSGILCLTAGTLYLINKG